MIGDRGLGEERAAGESDLLLRAGDIADAGSFGGDSLGEGVGDEKGERAAPVATGRGRLATRSSTSSDPSDLAGDTAFRGGCLSNASGCGSDSLSS